VKRFGAFRWMLPLGVVVLVAAHVLVVFRLASHFAIGMVAATGLALLVVLKHLGFFGSFTLFRRRER